MTTNLCPGAKQLRAPQFPIPELGNELPNGARLRPESGCTSTFDGMSQKCQKPTSATFSSCPSGRAHISTSLALLKVQQQGAKLAIRGVQADQFPGMKQCCGEVSLVPGNSDERRQHVSIQRMLLVRLLQ